MSAALAPLELLERFRRGDPIDAESVESFVRGWNEGSVGDAQMGAWLMGVCIRGLDMDATQALTRAMIASGDRLELKKFGVTGDKHSTGGVGDSTTLIAAPLASALGVRIAKMSGRGLGHTGGTIDKLESIPGFSCELDLASFVRQVRDVGIAVVGSSARLVPADKRLYSLRDQTGTVRSAALVAASVMSKKIAGGAQAIVLDVKVGEGAFFATLEEARAAAQVMVALGEPWGRSVRYIITLMDQPLGRMVGNALEVRGAAEVLNGGGPEDLREVAIEAAGTLAEAAGVVGRGEGRIAATEALDDGSARGVAERWVAAQGGDPGVWSDDALLPQAPETIDVLAEHDGFVQTVAAREVGEAARWLGAGRLHPDQVVDPAVGVELHVKMGDAVSAGEPLATLHVRDLSLADTAVERIRGAYRIGPDEVDVPHVIREVSPD